VDDDASICLLYEQELRRSGYEVETASSGQEAMEKINKERFDVAVLDIEMPDISGLDVLKNIKQELPDMWVILNTAYSTYMSDFNSWLADAYVVKSSDLTPLKDKIKELLGSR
jgi:DNA-binding NtrC family response regulator